jgi:phage tail protein X
LGGLKSVAITSYELVVVSSDYVTADIIVWRRYKTRAIGIVEALLDANPQLAVAHRSGPFIPVGTYVRIPIDPVILAGRQPVSVPDLWTDRAGYRL